MTYYGSYFTRDDLNGYLHTFSHSGRDVSTDSYSTQILGFNTGGSRSGVDNIKWQSQVRAGVSATTPFTATRSWSSSTPGDVTCEWRWSGVGDPVSFDRWTGNLYRTKANGTLLSFPSVTGIDATSANNQALTALYRNLSKQFLGTQSMIFFGELGETVHMLKHPLSSLQKGFSEHFGALSKRIRGVNKRRPSKLLDIVKGTWLEYSFGWTPLAMDVKDILLTIQSKKVRQPTVVGWGSSQSSQMSPVISTGAHYACIKYSIRDMSYVEVRYKVGLKDDCEYNFDADGWLDRFGITVDQFVPTLWELTPWSFFVDYFANIGNILDAIAARRFAPAWSVKTVRTLATTEVFGSLDEGSSRYLLRMGNPAFVSLKGDPGTLKLAASKIVRTADMPGIPTLEFSIPGSGQWRRWTNMAALTGQYHGLLNLLHPFRR